MAKSENLDQGDPASSNAEHTGPAKHWKRPAETTRDLRDVAKASVVSVAGEGLLQPLRVGLALLLTNTLGPSGYGIFAVARSVADVGENVSGAGLRLGVIRYAALAAKRGDRREEGTVVVSAAGLAVLLSLVIAASVLLLAPSLAGFMLQGVGFEGALQSVAAAIPVLALLQVVTGVAISRRASLPFTASRVASILTFGGVLLLLFLVSGRMTATAAAVSYGIGGALNLALTGWFCAPIWRSLRAEPLAYDGRVIRRLLRYVPPVALTRLGQQSTVGLVLIAAAIWLEGREVGQLAAGIRLSLLGLLAAQSFQSVLPSVVAQYLGTGQRIEAARVTSEVARWAAAVATPALGLGIACAPALCVLMGDGFEDAAPAVALAAVANLGMSFGSACGAIVLNMAGRQWVVARIGVVGGVLCLGLVPVLAPTLGVLGCAGAFAVSQCLIQAVYVIGGMRVLGAPLVPGCVWKYFVATGAAAAVSLLVAPAGISTALAQLALFGTTYVVVVAAIGLESFEKQLLEHAWRGLRESVGAPKR